MKTKRQGNKQIFTITTYVSPYVCISWLSIEHKFISQWVYQFCCVPRSTLNFITFCPAIFPLQSKRCKVTSKCALLIGLTASLLVALLLVPLCWWLFSIAAASSDRSILNESNVVSITIQDSSRNKSHIIDVFSNLPDLTTVSSKGSHGIHHYSQKNLNFCSVNMGI